MATVSEPLEVRADVSRVTQDLLVSLCGCATSLLTAIILAAVEVQTDFSFYTFMYWFVIPVGAICSGFLAASGYYAGARVFNHRPTKILLLNMAVISVSTYFIIQFLNYYFMSIDGKAVHDYIPFSQFLNVELTHTSIQFRMRAAKIGDAVELGATMGYVYAGLQIVGFALGGIAVYTYLQAQPYCEKCSKYLASKESQQRFTGNAEQLTDTVGKMLVLVQAGFPQDAVHLNTATGALKQEKEMHLRSSIQIKRCKDCGKHWLKLTVSKLSGNDWKEVNELGFETYTEQPLTTAKGISQAAS